MEEETEEKVYTMCLCVGVWVCLVAGVVIKKECCVYGRGGGGGEDGIFGSQAAPL